MKTSILRPETQALISEIDSWIPSGHVDVRGGRSVEMDSEGRLQIIYKLLIASAHPSWVVITVPVNSGERADCLLLGWISTLKHAPDERIHAWLDRQTSETSNGRVWMDERGRLFRELRFEVTNGSGAVACTFLEELFFSLPILWLDLSAIVSIPVNLPLDVVDG